LRRYGQASGESVDGRGLAVAFYRRVATDPILRPLFPGKTFTCAIEEFSAFLAQFFGSSGEDTQGRWWLSLRQSHQRFKIGQKERTAWMANMTAALEETGVEEPFRSSLLELFDHSSAYLVNTEARPDVKGKIEDPEIVQRWCTQLA